MTHDEFTKRIKEEVAAYVGCTEHEVYFPWVAKVLQNSKVLASAPGKGVPYFEFTLICEHLDGEKFLWKDRQPGVNFPPMHVNCRSSFDKVTESIDDIKRDLEEKKAEKISDVIKTSKPKLEMVNIPANTVKNIKEHLGIKLSTTNVLINRKGVRKHLIKRRHKNMLKYYDRLDDILSQPDYVGINPNEKGTSFETITILKDNILIGVKYDGENDYFYVASMYEVANSEIKAMKKNN